MAALNGRTVEYVLKQDLSAFVRLIGLSVAQARPASGFCQYMPDCPWLCKAGCVAEQLLLRSSKAAMVMRANT